MKRVLIFLNYAAVLALLLSYLAPYVDPATLWPIALFGLLYPFLLIANLIFIVYWIFRRKKFVWLSIVTIIIGWNYIGRYVQLRLDSDPIVAESDNIKLISYNVRLFDLYNWRNAENEITRDNIYSFLSGEASDILCLQEYYSNDDGEFSTEGAVMEVQKARYTQIHYTTSIDPGNWGIAIFSKWPIINKGVVEFEDKSNNICVFADVVVRDDTIRIYNAHLGSVHFGYEEYELLEKVGQQQGTRDSSGPLGVSSQIEKAKNEDVPITSVIATMIDLLKTAFVNRAQQTEAVAAHANTSPYPVIICGDINDTPLSYSYDQLAAGRRDAFRVGGSGFGNSYAGVIPIFRIDYMFIDDEIGLVDFKTKSDISFSDHYPLISILEL